MHGAGYCPSESKTSCRSLGSNGGLNKKTQPASNNVVAGLSEAPEVTMSYYGLVALAMAAVGGADDHAQIEQIRRIGDEVGAELHVDRLSCLATRHSGRCYKSLVSIRRRHRCSTAPMRVEKPLFKPSLNKEIRPVEHWCWINAVFRAGSISVSSAEITPILRPMDGNSHLGSCAVPPRHSASRTQPHRGECEHRCCSRCVFSGSYSHWFCWDYQCGFLKSRKDCQWHLELFTADHRSDF